MKVRIPQGMGGAQNMNAMIKQAQQMQEAMEQKQAELDARDSELARADADNRAELDARDASLNTFIIVVCVMSSVTLLGSGAFITWFFVDKRKR